MSCDNLFNISNYLIEECNIKKGRENKIALYNKDITYTYGDIDKRINQFANYILEIGLSMEDRIGLLMPNQPEYIYLFLGAIKIGVIPVLINTRYDLDDLNYIIEESRIKYLFTTEEFKDKVHNSDYEFLKQIILIKDQEEYIYHLGTSCKAAPTTKDDIAFWLFTSGSGGRPKGVMHFQHDILTVINNFSKSIVKANSNDIFYTHTVASFAIGLAMISYIPFSEGASTVVADDDSIYSIFDNIKKYKATIFAGVPTVYNSILKLSNSDNKDLHNMRLCFAGGEGLPQSIFDDWKEKYNCEILQAYGSTETLLAVISDRVGERKTGSTGKLVPGYQAEIIDDENNILANGMVGELFVAGDSIMQGYWNDKEKTNKVKYGNGIKTGDRFYRDDEGYFWYLGRNSETFKVNGLWVNASEIESVILTHPFVKEAAVEGEISEEESTKIIAYIAIGEESAIHVVDEIKKMIRQKLSRSMCPKKFHIVESLPKGVTGKLKRAALKDIQICNTLI